MQIARGLAREDPLLRRGSLKQTWLKRRFKKVAPQLSLQGIAALQPFIKPIARGWDQLKQLGGNIICVACFV